MTFGQLVKCGGPYIYMVLAREDDFETPRVSLAIVSPTDVPNWIGMVAIDKVTQLWDDDLEEWQELP